MARSPSNLSGGIQVPIQPGQNGGLRMLEGDDYINQLITILSLDGSCENPFSDVGFGLEAIFANMSDGGWRAQQQRKIEDTFKDLEREKVAKLLRTNWNSGPGEGEYTVVISYFSIETATENDVTVNLKKTL